MASFYIFHLNDQALQIKDSENVLTSSPGVACLLKNNIMAEGIAKSHPLKRIGQGGDAAAMAKFLLTEESSWITGQVIAVDGGRSKLA